MSRSTAGRAGQWAPVDVALSVSLSVVAITAALSLFVLDSASWTDDLIAGISLGCALGGLVAVGRSQERSGGPSTEEVLRAAVDALRDLSVTQAEIGELVRADERAGVEANPELRVYLDQLDIPAATHETDQLRHSLLLTGQPAMADRVRDAMGEVAAVAGLARIHLGTKS